MLGKKLGVFTRGVSMMLSNLAAGSLGTLPLRSPPARVVLPSAEAFEENSRKQKQTDQETNVAETMRFSGMSACREEINCKKSRHFRD